MNKIYYRRTIKSLLKEINDGVFSYRNIKASGPNVRDDEGDAPLHVVASWGDLAAVRILIDAGAEVDALGEFSVTPLQRAVGLGHYAIARLLLEHGANPHVKNELGMSAMMKAQNSANPEMRKLFSV
jgi:uncharacterized protein